MAVQQEATYPREEVEHSPSSSPVSPPSSPSGTASPRMDSSGDADCSNREASSSSTSSRDVGEAQQESCWLPGRLDMCLNRELILLDIIDKISSCHQKVLDLPIPTCGRRCYAKLTIRFISYLKERTDWPDRFCRMSCDLKIPSRYVDALTVCHRCTVVININVSSTPSRRNWNDLLDGGRPLTLKRAVTPGATNVLLVNKCEAVRQSVLIDAHSESLHVAVSAWFELQEVRYAVLEDGQVTVTDV